METSEETKGAMLSPESAALRPVGSAKKILLVEDEALIALEEAEIIKNFGYEVFVCHSGEKALEFLKSNPPVQLVLLDIDLGRGIDGTETARRILSEINVPIVFLTYHTEREMVAKVRGLTRYGYIIKNSGDFVLQSSIEMAFELFEAYGQVKDKEERYRTLAENASDGILLVAGDETIIDVNTVGLGIGGYQRSEIIGKKVSNFLVSEDLLREPLRFEEARSGDIISNRRRLLQKDGNFVAIEFRVKALPNGLFLCVFHEFKKREPDGEAKTDVRRLVNEKEVLLKELHLRIKDTLSMIQGMLTMQMQQNRDPVLENVLRDIRRRISVMNTIYSKLKTRDYKTVTLKDFFPILIDEITAASILNREITIEKEIGDIALDMSLVLPLGLLLNELITNAIEHAFPDRRPGRITVRMAPEGAFLIVEIADDGIGFQTKDGALQTKGLGLPLAGHLVEQLGGKMETRREKGTGYLIRIPLEKKTLSRLSPR